MSKSSLIVCGILAAISLTNASTFAGLKSVDAATAPTEIATATVNAGNVNWMSHLSGVDKGVPTATPTTNASSIAVPSPVSALLLVAGLTVAFGGRRRQPGFVPQREDSKFKVVTNHATRTEACMVRFHRTGVLTRRRNPMIAQA